MIRKMSLFVRKKLNNETQNGSEHKFLKQLEPPTSNSIPSLLDFEFKFDASGHEGIFWTNGFSTKRCQFQKQHKEYKSLLDKF